MRPPAWAGLDPVADSAAFFGAFEAELTARRAAARATFVVTTTSDAGPGSLRQAILDANADPASADRITFAIPGDGVRAILPATALPAITGPVDIDGYSQPGSRPSASPSTVNPQGLAARPLVALFGTADLPDGTDGLVVVGPQVTVSGLVVAGFNRGDPSLLASGIIFSGLSAVGGGVFGSFIGPHADGSACGGGNTVGVLILGGASETFVGQIFDGTANLIGCNGTGVAVYGSPRNYVVGNLIGLNVRLDGATPLVPLRNALNGVVLAFDGARGNAVIANAIAYTNEAFVSQTATNAGLLIAEGADDNVVQANRIGFHYTGVRIHDNGTGNGPERNRLLANEIGRVRIPVPAGPFAPAFELDAPNTGAGVEIRSASDNDVGGPGGGRNVISANGGGVVITGASRTNEVKGNYIGTDVSGSEARRNVQFGVYVGLTAAPGVPSGNVIGGLSAGEGNVISGNGGEGIRLTGSENTLIVGNFIGLSGSGLSPMGNAGPGVTISRSSGNRIGLGSAANTIAYNRGGGVIIGSTGETGPTTSRANSVESNRIDANERGTGFGLGIDLGNDGVTPNDAGDADDGPNGLTNAPVILTANVTGNTTTVRAQYQGTPGATVVFEMYANKVADPSRSGEGLLPFFRTNPYTIPASGVLEFEGTVTGVPLVVGALVTGLAHASTAFNGQARFNTSEFSNAVAVGGSPGGVARFQIQNASAGLAAFERTYDIFINGREVGYDLDFLEATASFEVPAGVPLTLEIKQTSNGLALLRPTTVTLPAGTYQNLFLIGLPIGEGPFSENDEGASILEAILFGLFRPFPGVAPPPGEGRARVDVGVTVVHAVTDAPRVDVVVLATGQVLARGLRYGVIAESVAVPAGRTTVEVRRSADQSVLTRATFNLNGLTGLTVPLTFAGFVNPSRNRNGPGLTLSVIQPSGLTIVDAEHDADGGPAALALDHARPNPVRDSATLAFTLAAAGPARLAVYDVLGREVAVLTDGERAAGVHVATLRAGLLAPGLYVVRLVAGGEARVQRLTVAR